MRKTPVWVACVLAIGVRADNLPVTVKGTTATQAILSYTAPDSNACSVAVSESSGLAAPVNDVNPALFTGADSDQRAGNVTSGTSRIVVIGQRTAAQAVDGNFYSRALQAFTQHYFSITCGASTGSGTFTTNNPPLGNSAPDTVPYLQGAWGNAAWPSMDFTNQSRQYVDPNTGFLIERITGPGQSGSFIAPNTAYYVQDIAGTWTNPQNMVSAQQGFAAYSGPGGQVNALYLPTSVGLQPGFTSNQAVDDLRVRISGYTDQSATLSACITVDHGQSCASAAVTLSALPQGSSNAAQVAAPASFPSPVFAGWGQLKLTAEQTEALAGTAAVSGSAVTWVSAGNGVNGINTTYFPLSLKTGDHILIAGSEPVCPQNDCTIANLVDAEHLTIMQNLGSWTGFSTTVSASTAPGATSFTLVDASGLIRDLQFNKYSFQFADSTPESIACTTLSGSTLSGCNAAANAHASGAPVTSTAFSFTNFGVLLWKTAGTDGNVFLNSANFDVAGSNVFSVGDDGTYNPCSVQTVTVNYAADGATPLNPPALGRTCQLLDYFGNPLLYLFVPQTGEARLLAYGDQVKGNTTTGTFDPNDPNTVYYAQNGLANPNVFKCAYNASAGHYAALSPNYTNAASPNYGCTSITTGGGNDLLSQIGKVVPGFDATYFNRVSGFGGMVGNYISITVQEGQNSIGYSCGFDVTQPAGSQVVGCHDTWTTYPQRWGGAHGLFTMRTSAGWGATFLVPLASQGTTGIGLYQFSVNSITGASGTTALTSTVSTDPTTNNCSTLGVTDPRWIALGASGNNCIQMVVATEPQNLAPSTTDKVKWPSACNPNYSQLQTIQPGDYLYDPANGNQYGENFLVALKTGSGCSPITLVLARGVNQACAAAPQAHRNGWTPVVGATANCNGNEYWLNVTNPGTAYVDNSGTTLGHSYIGQPDNTGINLAQYTVYAASTGYTGYGVRQGALPVLIGQGFSYGVNMVYPFAGSTAGVGINYIQTHPGGQSYQATPNTLGYDGRPLGGAGGGVGAVWYHAITGPVSGTSQVYKISCAQATPGGSCIESLDRKRLGMLAFAGRFLLTDISGPASTITDSNPYTYCIADFPGECRPGSSQGDRFVNVPNMDTGGVCVVGALDRNTPCLATAPVEVGQAVQFDWGAADPNALNWRRLGYVLGGPGQTNNYWNVHGIVDGSWAFTEVDWKEGVRKDIVAIKLPPWPGPPADGISRSNFVSLVVPIQGQAGDSVQIRFGYDTNLYCTSRRDQCTTSGAAPFAWLSEAHTVDAKGLPGSVRTNASVRQPLGVACPASCEVDIPALSGRVLYYVVDHLSSRGVLTSSTMQVVAVP